MKKTAPTRKTKTYIATFYTDANYAEQEFEATTPEQALAAAREVEGGDDSSLYYESYDEGASRR